jgi:hypothetical protein
LCGELKVDVVGKIAFGKSWHLYGFTFYLAACASISMIFSLSATRCPSSTFVQKVNLKRDTFPVCITFLFSIMRNARRWG